MLHRCAEAVFATIASDPARDETILAAVDGHVERAEEAVPALVLTRAACIVVFSVVVRSESVHMCVRQKRSLGLSLPLPSPPPPLRSRQLTVPLFGAVVRRPVRELGALLVGDAGQCGDRPLSVDVGEEATRLAPAPVLAAERAILLLEVVVARVDGEPGTTAIELDRVTARSRADRVASPASGLVLWKRC